MKTSIGTFCSRVSSPLNTFAYGSIQSSAIYFYQTLATCMQPIKKKREATLRKADKRVLVSRVEESYPPFQ
jgi:hypothetical protein